MSTGHEIVVVRHGQTEWSETGQHTGTTDIALTADGEAAARGLAEGLARRSFALVLVSPLQRARRTADLAGLTDYEVEPRLVEWDYGAAEGRTTAEISDERGSPWRVWTHGVLDMGGEAVESVAERSRAVLERAEKELEHGDVLLVGHGHALRVLAACWLGLSPQDGALFALSAPSVGVLGHEHDRPVLRRWNCPSA